MKNPVNSAKKFLASVLGAAAFAASAETGLTVDGTVLRFNVDSGDTLTWSEAFPENATAFFKTGTGTLEISSDNSQFKGPADIVEGAVKILHKNALGASSKDDRLTDGAISVSNNAELVTYCPTVSQTAVAISKRLVLSGTGTDGTGALKLGTVEWGNQDYYISHLVLAGDATVLNTDGRRYGITVIDPQGHELKLTIGKGGGYMFRESKHITAGTVRYSAPVTWQTGQTFVDDPEGRIIIDSGRTLTLFDGAGKTVCPWTLEFGGSGNTYLSVTETSSSVWTNTFIGPVEFNSNPHISGGRVTFHGPVTGTGFLNTTAAGIDFKSSVTRRSGKMSIGKDTKVSCPPVVRYGEGAIITNYFSVGANENSFGAIHQYGGTVRSRAASGDKRYVGLEDGSYGYLGIYGGSYTFGKYSFLACGRGSAGMVEVTDGSFTAEDAPVNAGCGGWGEIYMTGGKFTIYGDIIGSDNLAETGRMTLTLAGDGDPLVTLPWGGKLVLRTATNDYVSIVNLNAGTLRASGIAKSTAYANVLPSVKRYLNFGGGALASHYNTSAIFGTGETALDRVTVFAGGAKFNADKNLSQSSDTPLLRPTGRGIASISLPEGMPNGNYAGPPAVRISGGGGEGASAHAMYDPQTRTVTGIEVTSPGWDFTSEPTVTVSSSTNMNVTYECEVTLTGEEQVDGGLTLIGGKWNVLTLNAVNDYRGDTVLGSHCTQLNIAAPGALPAASTVVFAGGHLNNTSGVPHHKFAVDCKAALEAGGFKYHAGISFPEGSTIDIRNADCFPENAEKTTLVKFMYNVSGIPTITGLDFGRQSARIINGELKIYNKKGMTVIVR